MIKIHKEIERENSKRTPIIELAIFVLDILQSIGIQLLKLISCQVQEFSCWNWYPAKFRNSAAELDIQLSSEIQLLN